MLRSKKAGSVRWLVLGLSAHGLAAALLLNNVLSSSTERELAAPPAAPRAEPPAPAAPVEAAPRTSQREPMRLPEPDALAARVRSTAEALAAALEAPGYEDARWRAEVRGRARTLGEEALPALEALLADDSRSVEEHVAATELVAALKQP